MQSLARLILSKESWKLVARSIKGSSCQLVKVAECETVRSSSRQLCTENNSKPPSDI